MRTPRILPCLLALLALSGCGGDEPDPEPVLEKPARILFVTQSVGYEHEVVKRTASGGLSIAEIALLKACKGRYECATTQDASTIAPGTLLQLDAVIFYTTGELPIPEVGRTALIDWVKGGGAFIGIHSATDTFYEWPAYGELIGGYFDGHPWHESVRIHVEDTQHPSTKHLGKSFEITEEIYQFKNWKRDDVKVLLSLVVSSVDLGAKGVNRTDADFALAWCKPYGKGRMFYTALGHRPDVWQDDRFIDHVMGGIEWALGR